MGSQIDVKNANCTGLELLAPVELLKKDGAGDKFKIEAYTGEAVERWWGLLAIDIDGITAKKKIPILMNHNTREIVGFSTDTYKNGSFFVSGQYSGVTKSAKEAKELAAEGFPWQASIGVRPLKILSLEKGATDSVNGKTVTGPAEIWLESEVFETSFVPLGADSNTSISTFSKFTEAQQGANQEPHKKEQFMEITLEKLAKDAPALLAEIQTKARAEGKDEGLTEGTKLGEARIIELAKAHFADGDKFETLATSGVTLAQYLAVKDLQPKVVPGASGEDMKAKILAELEADKIGDPGTDGKDPGATGPKTFMEAYQSIKDTEKLTSQKAMSKAARLYPELYDKHSKGGK